MTGIWDLVQNQYKLIARKQNQILAGNGATEKNNQDLSKHIQQLAGLLEMAIQLQKIDVTEVEDGSKGSAQATANPYQ